MLRPDNGDILMAILQETRHPGSTSDEEFKIPPYAVRVNSFLFVGLFISIFVALFGILVKHWARSYQRNLDGVSSAHLRARIRHYRYVGAKYWKLQGFIAFLSICMNLALFISAIGILQLLFATTPQVAFAAAIVFALGTAIVIVTSFIPVFYPEAPFRSPLSKPLVAFRNWIHTPAHLRKDEEGKGAGLEDDVKQSPGAATKENSIVRTRLHLDLDILTHLMEHADKSTERGILDHCLQRLRCLTLLEKENPELILKQDIVYEVYAFLAKGCLVEGKPGAKEVDPDRLARSQQLCEFLRWFLSIERSSQSRSAIKARLKKFNYEELPRTLAEHYAATTTNAVKDTALAIKEATSAVMAYAALGRVEHLLVPEPDEQECKLCSDRIEQIGNKLQSRDEMMQNITMVIIGFSDCLLYWDRTGPLTKDYTEWCNKRCTSARTRLKSVLMLPEYRPLDKETSLWKAALEQKRNVRDELMTVWFTPLKALIELISTFQPPLPFDQSTRSDSQSNPGTPAAGGRRSPSPNRFSPGGPGPSASSGNLDQSASTSGGYLAPPQLGQGL